MPLEKSLLAVLACPWCKGKLDYRKEPKEELWCPRCQRAYPVEDGIPNFLA